MIIKRRLNGKKIPDVIDMVEGIIKRDVSEPASGKKRPFYLSCDYFMSFACYHDQLYA